MKKSVILSLAALLAAPNDVSPQPMSLPLFQQAIKRTMQESDPSARQIKLFQGSAKAGETKNHQIQLTAGTPSSPSVRATCAMTPISSSNLPTAK